MIKEEKVVFTLTSKEINLALYDFYVRKLKENNINAVFCAEDIKLVFNDFLEVSLTIKEEKVLT